MSSTETRRPIRKIGPLTGALAVAASLMMATPANAETGVARCAVTPLAPAYAGHDLNTGDKLAAFAIKVNCLPDTIVEVQQERYEKDSDSPDDQLGNWIYRRSYPPNIGLITINNIKPVPNTEDGAEELYHRVRFRVSSNAPWSAWKYSAVTSMNT